MFDTAGGGFDTTVGQTVCPFLYVDTVEAGHLYPQRAGGRPLYNSGQDMYIPFVFHRAAVQALN